MNGDGYERKRMGLVVGLGPAAGIYYYRRLIEEMARLDAAPSLFLAHADLRTFFACLRSARPGSAVDYLVSLVDGLSRSGCEAVALSAVTPHVFIEEIAANTPAYVVDLLSALRAEIARRGVERVALLGTRYVVDSNCFGSLPNVRILRPTPNEIEEIDRTYTAVTTGSIAPDVARHFFSTVAQRLVCRERLDAVVLAGTDLSDLYAGYDAGFPTIDAAEAHIAAIVGAITPSTEIRTLT